MMVTPQPTPMQTATQPQESAKRPADVLDVWLRRALHQSFDTMLSTPVPANLLQLASQ
jgi:hypothetical protein